MQTDTLTAKPQGRTTMTTNPLEDCPPDEFMGKITIHATLENRDHGGKRVQGPLWHIVIPEIAYDTYTRNLTKELAVAVASIEEHNEEFIMEEKAWHKDKQKLIDTASGILDHDKRQQRKIADKWKAYRNDPTQTSERNLSQSINYPGA
jgi:hypothetical protein